MDAFELKAKASECRLLAVDAEGERRERLLALADEYEAIHLTLVTLKAEQPTLTKDDPDLPEIPGAVH